MILVRFIIFIIIIINYNTLLLNENFKTLNDWKTIKKKYIIHVILTIRIILSIKIELRGEK